MHIEFLIEEPSAEAALDHLLPRMLPAEVTYKLIVFQGKQDLLVNLPGRLRGYAVWMPQDWRIVVLIDEDREDCRLLKQRLEDAALTAGLRTKTRSPDGQTFQVLNRIAIEELEAWFLGDTEAIHQAYPAIPAALAQREKFRNPDSIRGGTWESLAQVLEKARYFPKHAYPKTAVARAIAQHMQPQRNRSHSFQVFWQGLKDLR